VWQIQESNHDSFFTLLDLAPTFYERPLPSYAEKEWKERQATSRASAITVLTVKKKPSSHGQLLVFGMEHAGYACCAKGDWEKSHKLTVHLLSKILKNYMLFQKDFSRQNDLRENSPEKISRKMLSEWSSWSQKVGVICPHQKIQ